MPDWTPDYQPQRDPDEYPFDVQRYGLPGMELFDATIKEYTGVDGGLTEREAAVFLMLQWPTFVAALEMQPQETTQP